MNNAQQTWNIKVTEPAPSMNQKKTVFQAATYAEAVQVAQDVWRAARRSVTLASGEYGIYNSHIITASGLATDRNFNSGIPEVSQLAA